MIELIIIIVVIIVLLYVLVKVPSAPVVIPQVPQSAPVYTTPVSGPSPIATSDPGSDQISTAPSLGATLSPVGGPAVPGPITNASLQSPLSIITSVLTGVTVAAPSPTPIASSPAQTSIQPSSTPPIIAIPTATPVYIAPAPVPTPTSTSTVPTYLGCYKDMPTRDIANEASTVMTIDACASLAKSKGAPYFSLQWPQGTTTPNTAVCFYGPTYGKYGTTTTCTINDSNGRPLGNTWANAVYKL